MAALFVNRDCTIIRANERKKFSTCIWVHTVLYKKIIVHFVKYSKSCCKKPCHRLGAPPTEIVGHAPREFHEHCHVQGVLVIAEREPDVGADELVRDFQVGRETLEKELLILVVYSELLGLPVDVPGLHGRVAPRLLLLATVQVHQDEPVVRNAEQFLLGKRRGGGSTQPRAAYSLI